MEMNINCMRDVLSYIIENQKINDNLQILPTKTKEIYDSDSLKKYTKQELFYSLYLLNDGEYIKCFKMNCDNTVNYIEVSKVTYKGHRFYETVREPTVWEKTQSILKKAGIHTLEFVMQVAHDVAVESVKAITSGL